MRPLLLKSLAYAEYDLRRRVGCGQRYPFKREGLCGYIELTLAEEMIFPAPDWTWWQYDNGTLALANSEPILNVFSSFPALIDCGDYGDWKIYNHYLSLELNALFGNILPAKAIPLPPFMTLRLRVCWHDIDIVSLCASDIKSIAGLLDNIGWQPVKNNFRIPGIFVPIPVGEVLLTFSQLSALQRNDLLLPQIKNFACNGAGFIRVGRAILRGQFQRQQNAAVTGFLIDEVNHMSDSETNYPDADSATVIGGNTVAGANPGQLDTLPLTLTIQCGSLVIPYAHLQTIAAGSVLTVKNSNPGTATLCYHEHVLASGTLVTVNGDLGFLIGSIISQIKE